MEEIYPPYYKRLHAWRIEEWAWNMIEDGRLLHHMKGRNAYIMQACVEKIKRDKIFKPYEKFLKNSDWYKGIFKKTKPRR